MKNVCVIGAGPSGITAAKNLLDEGLQVTVYDYGKEVGGNWVFSEDESHSSVFETTHIISSKTLSQYADFPMPADYPDYPSHKQLAAYFQSYAQYFGLYPFIHFQTEVKKAELTADGKWLITTERRGQTETAIFDALVVCNGHHWQPRWPSYPGQFAGEYIHSHHVKRFSRFKDKRVLVIGGGNSACDVAVESSRVSARTDISWRRGYWITPKFLFGEPADVVGKRMKFLPRSLWSRVSEFSIRLKFGSHKHYGLPEPDHRFGQTHPTINDELYYFMRHGKIHPRPEITRWEGHTVYFTDGSQAEYDTVVACTGYVIAHPFFDKSFIDYSQGKVPLYLRMMHPTIQNLYFIGLFQPLGCIWPAAELQAKIAARELAGKWQRPTNIQALIDKELKNPDFQQINTPRHTITVDFHRFSERLLKHLPKDYVRKEPRQAVANASELITDSSAF